MDSLNDIVRFNNFDADVDVMFMMIMTRILKMIFRVKNATLLLCNLVWEVLIFHT